jgi:arylsulfatase A-like enzyme/Flp pilus assembly protein TadD
MTSESGIIFTVLPLSSAISRRRLTGAAVILLFVGLFAVWSTWRRASPLPIPRESGLSVLLITIDTLRADAVGAYGQPGDVTPWIDRLAAGGARFTNAHAHNVVTLPSHANILSGRLPSDHGVRDNAGFRFPANIDTLATVLKSHGYNTGAFVSAFPLESRFGLSRGFDVYDDRFADAARPAFLIQERAGRETTARAVRWLDTQRENRWFCWVHIYEPHFPYTPAEPFASRFPADSYHAEVAAADASLAPLLESIVQTGGNSRTLVVLTSDHGESLGDNGEATHGVFAYEATLKVPLVIYQPRLLSAAVVDAPTQHVDILPTILDALALPIPSDLPGRTLLPTIAGNGQLTANEATYFEALSATLNRRWAPLDGVIQDRVKFIDLPIPELYDLSADPREQRNLASAQPARVDALRTVLGRFRRGNAIAPQPETAETRERLRSLGYLAASGNSLTARYSEADDPKRLIALDSLMQDTISLYLAGNLDAAAGRCRELIGRRPDMPLSFLYLAQIERERGQLDSAVEALRKAVALASENAEMVALLGAYLTQAGKAVEATAALERYERNHEPDVEVLTSHALALAKLGRSKDALAVLGRARDLDPSNAMLLVNTATVLLMSGNRESARAQFEAALRMNPDLARAHSSLGILDVEDRRLAEAAAHWKAATSADPREFETILGIALSLHRARRTAEARTALEFFVANAPPSRFSAEIDRARRLLATLQ